MTIMFASQACTFTRTDLFIAEATIQKQHTNETHLPVHYTPILGSFVDYRKKRSHNRMIDLHWALKHIAPKCI